MKREYTVRVAYDDGTVNDFFDEAPPQVNIRGETITIVWAPTDGHSAITELKTTDGTIYVGNSVWAQGTSHQQRANVQAVL